jgi:hypothetical protein
MVKVLMTCAHNVRRVTIDPSVMDDREMLEDLVAAALNDAMRRAEEASQERMAGFSAGLNLPPGSRCRSDEYPVEPRVIDRGFALPAGCWSKIGAAHGLPPAAAQSPGAQRLADALQLALGALRHCQRCNTFTESESAPAACRQARPQPAVRRRDAGGHEHARADACLFGLYYVLMGRVSPLDGIGPANCTSSACWRAPVTVWCGK